MRNAYHKQKYNSTILSISYYLTALGFPLSGSNLFPIFIEKYEHIRIDQKLYLCSHHK